MSGNDENALKHSNCSQTVVFDIPMERQRSSHKPTLCAVSDAHTHDTNNVNAIAATLVLQGFASSPVLDFGNVVIGSQKVLYLRLFNPSSESIEVSVSSFKSAHTVFSVNLESFIIASHSDTIMHCFFSPSNTREGNTTLDNGGIAFRDSLHLRAGNRHRFRVILTGKTFISPPKKRKKKMKSSLMSHSVTKTLSRPQSLKTLSHKKSNSSSSSSSSNAHHHHHHTQPQSQSKLSSSQSYIPIVQRKKGHRQPQTPSTITLEGIPRHHSLHDMNDNGKQRRSISVGTRSRSTEKAMNVCVSVDDMMMAQPSITERNHSLTGEMCVEKKHQISSHHNFSSRTKKNLHGYRQQQVYDENWIHKQQQGFQRWLNFLLPQQQHTMTSNCNVNLNVTFHTLAEYQAIAKLRQKALCFYHTPSIQHVVYQLEKFISCGDIAIRSSIRALSDVGLRDQLADILLCYNSQWLKIALETVFGECISVNNDRNIIFTLRCFIMKRILSNKDIDDEHTYLESSKGQMFFTSEREKSLERFALKKILIVIFFLDQAKENQLMECDLCLFNQTSFCKSTRELVLNLSKYFLEAQGDFVRCLDALGWRCVTIQTALQEFDYTVSNIHIDLRDGVRLCRLAHIITSNHNIMKKVLLPASNRTRKKHNVSLALSALRGLSSAMGGCNHDDIVDGHCERTLTLLWRIIVHTILPSLINVSALQHETKLVQNTHQNIIATQSKSDIHDINGLGKAEYLFVDNEICQALLDWSNAICVGYGYRIRNFTSSFADGRAFCLLIHFYHPTIMPFEDIRDNNRAKHTIHNDDNNKYLNFIHVDSVEAEQDKAIEDEISNFRLLHEKILLLGCVPSMLLTSRQLCGSALDEKLTITFLSYLSSRLLMLSRECHASRCIQHAWHRHKHRRALRINATHTLAAAMHLITYHHKMLQQKNIISLHHHLHLQRQNTAATLIQRYARGMFARRSFRLVTHNIIIIQSLLRRRSATHIAQQRINALKTLQATFTSVATHTHFHTASSYRRHHAIITLQAFACTLCVCVSAAAALTHTHTIITIQTMLHAYCVRARWLKHRSIIVYLQRRIRANAIHTMYIFKREMIVRLQRVWRSHTQRRQRTLTLRRHTALTIITAAFVSVTARQAFQQCYTQRRYANCLALLHSTLCQYYTRRCFHTRRHAVLLLQSVVRRQCAVTRYRALRHSVVNVQRASRSHQQRNAFIIMRNAVIHIQCAYRYRIQHHRHNAYRERVVLAQSVVRRQCAVTRYRALRHSVVNVQRARRSHQQRNAFIIMRNAVILIQCAYRYRMQRHRHNAFRERVVLAQSVVRRQCAVTRYRALRHSVVNVQRARRSHQQRNAFIIMRNAVIHIQCAYRYRMQRHRHNAYRERVVLAQSGVRSCIARHHVHHQRHAIITIQCAFNTAAAQHSHHRVVRAHTHAATLTLQRVYRGVVVRRHVAAWRKHRALLTLQSALHTHYTHTMLRQRDALARRCNARVTLQRYVCARVTQRRYVRYRAVTQTLQSALHTQCIYTTFQRQRSCIVRVQALYRAHCVRRESRARVRNARRRIRDARERWRPELTLGYRTRVALDTLLTGSKLAPITQACRVIELVTRLLPSCCVDAAEHKAVPVLFALIQSLNRSKPHVELLGHTLEILFHLAKCELTKHYIFDNELCVDVIVELLQTQRDNYTLFMRAVQILDIGCRHHSMFINTVSSTPEAVKRMSSIFSIQSRKLEMQQRFSTSSKAQSEQLCLLKKSVKAIDQLLRVLR